MSSRTTAIREGKAFELSVASELLFHGFNCSIPLVDAGIDVIAWKSSRFFKVQVKGRNFSGHGTSVESYRFSRSSYEDPLNRPDFIVMTIRNTGGNPGDPTYGISNHVVFPSIRFDELVSKELIVQKDDHWVANVWAVFEKGVVTRVVFQRGYGKPKPGEDMTKFLNAWDGFDRSPLSERSSDRQ